MTAPHPQNDAADHARVLPPRLDPRGSGSGRSGSGSARGGRSARRRGLRVFLACVSCLVFVATVGGWAAYFYVDGKVNRVDLGLGSGGDSGGVGTANYLLVGTDSRAGTNGKYGDAPGQRSDTTILAHLTKDGTTTMVSFPRDMYVLIPEYTDGAGKRHKAWHDKFNAAISVGGPSLLVQTVQSLTGLQVDHYISMDLEGFKEITDAIGGVQVCIKPSDAKPSRYQDDRGRWRMSTNTNDPMSGFVGGPGTIQLGGDQALAFVRQRHGLPDGDFDRIRRQQQFIGSMFHKIMADDTLTNPIKAQKLVSAAASALTLDNHTSIADLRSLGTRVRGLATGGLQMQTVPVHAPTRAEGAIDDNGNIRLHGVPASVQLYRPDDLQRIVAPMGGKAEGASSTTDAGSGGTGPALAPGAAAAPSQVRVAVYNGSSRAGLASKVTEQLTAKGFHARNAGNASVLTHETSRVLYAPGQEAEANTVAAAVPGSVLLADASITGVQLVLGSGFTAVVTPSVTAGGTAPAPAPAAAGPAAGLAPPGAPSPGPPTCTY